MMARTDMDHLPWTIRQELNRITAMVFEAFAETLKDRLSEQYRAGRILKLILHGPHAERGWEQIPPGEAFRVLVIVNYPRLARSDKDWRQVRDRLARAWEFGEITHPVRLTVESLERVNRALTDGIPYFVTISDTGIPLYQMEGVRLQVPRPLSAADRRAREAAEFTRWHRSGEDFLVGAAFYRSHGKAPMAALMLHQACEHFYLCVLWSRTLHGPRTHALDELREAAETLDARLSVAWPRETPFERRAFGCVRRAYVEARYGRSYRITAQELAWAFGRVEILREQVLRGWANYQAPLAPAAPMQLLPPTAETAVAVMRSHPAVSTRLSQRLWRVTRGSGALSIRWNRLIPTREFWRSNAFARWVHRISLATLSLGLLFIGADLQIWRERSAPAAQTTAPTPADPSAVLDFDVHADTVLGAVEEIANRAGYQTKANEDLWTVRWTGAYRAKATTFDALADVLYGSGLCPAIRDDTITVRFCDKTHPPKVETVNYQAQPGETVHLQVGH